MEIKYYVRYKIKELTQDKLHKDGPYDSWDEANEHYLDISCYEGVSNCYISEIQENYGE